MKKHRTMSLIITLSLLVAMLIPVTALAASPNYPFKFEFYDLANQKDAPHQKGDSEQNWYVSLYNNGVNTLSDYNILGLRMNRGGSYVSDYHTFSRYVSGYRLPYTTRVSSDNWMVMGAKKDSDSTSNAPLRISGQVNP